MIPWSTAQARHAACAGQARQIRLASSIWRSAGPIVPTGKGQRGAIQSALSATELPDGLRITPPPELGEVRTASAPVALKVDSAMAVECQNVSEKTGVSNKP